MTISLLPVLIASVLLTQPSSSALHTQEGNTDQPGKTELAPGTIYFIAEDSALEELLRPQLDAAESLFELSFDPQASPSKADPQLKRILTSRETLEESKESTALFLRGGSFMGWYHLAYPKESVSYLPQLLVHAAKSKKPVFAVGGACAFLGGGVVVPRKDLDKRQRNPRVSPDAPEARVHLDLGPGLMFGSDSWPGSSPGRLLRSMHENQVTRAAYFIGPVALEFNRATRTLVVRGPGRLLILDMTRARVFPRGYRGGRLSSLGEGDHWKVGSAPIRMGAGKVEAEPRWIASDAPFSGPALPRTLAESNSSGESEPPPLSGTELLQWIEWPRKQKSTIEDKSAKWTLDWDERAQRERTADASKRRTWLNLPFDCSWGEKR